MKIKDLFALTPEDKRNAVVSFRTRVNDEISAWLDKKDWRTNENSNIDDTYDAMRHHIASLAIAETGLNEFPKKVGIAHRTGWLHLHDLGMQGAGFIRYCCSVGFRQLIAEGMHPNTRIAAKPAKHLSSLINQLINFFTILSHECYSEDTEVLTENGWKHFYELESGEKVATFNINTREFEYQEPFRYIDRESEGKMIRIKNEAIDLLVTPNHLMYVELKLDGIGGDVSYVPVFMTAEELMNFYDDVYFTKVVDFDGGLCVRVRVNNYDCEEINYSGRVYCVEVPNHTIVVKRNGHIVVSSNCAGATAVNSLDVLCAPFIREDRLYYKELLGLTEEQSWKFIDRYVEQCIQELIFHLNYSNRSGGQAIFSNVMLELSLKNSDLKDEYCIVGGKVLDYKYGELQKEVDLFNRKFIKTMIDGDGRGQPFTFPIVTLSLSPSFTEEISPELKSLIAEASIKQGLFYFQNCINGVMAKNKKMEINQIRSSCCRLFNDIEEVRIKMGGQFGSGDNTGSLAVVTLNLPRYGYVAKKMDGDTLTNFYQILDIMLDIAKQALLIRRENIIKYRKMGLTPLTDVYDPPDFKTYFLTFGIVGLHECLINMGYENGVLDVKDESHIAYQIVSYIFDKVQQFQKETGLLMNLEYVPAEGCSYRLAKIDKKYFPDIYTSGEYEPFYSNSVLPPPDEQGDIIKLTRIANVLVPVASGGSVVHYYTNDKLDENGFWAFIDFVTQTKIPYFTLTRIISFCENCGAFVDDELKDTCPTCGNEVTKMTRVIGYLRPIKNFNVGKKEEFRTRKLTRLQNAV